MSQDENGKCDKLPVEQEKTNVGMTRALLVGMLKLQKMKEQFEL